MQRFGTAALSQNIIFIGGCADEDGHVHRHVHCSMLTMDNHQASLAMFADGRLYDCCAGPCWLRKRNAGARSCEGVFSAVSASLRRPDLEIRYPIS